MAIFSANIAVDFSSMSMGSFFVASPSAVLEATSSLIRVVTPDGYYQDYIGSFNYYSKLESLALRARFKFRGYAL